MLDEVPVQPLSQLERRVVLLPPTRRDAEVLGRVLTGAGMECVVCSSIHSAVDEAARGAGVALISEEALHSGADGLVPFLRAQAVWSDLPVIVLSRSGIESPMLSRILSALGNVSVIERPVRITTLLSLIKSALRARQRQYEVRDHIVDRQRSESELRQSRDAFFSLVDRAPFGVYVVNASFSIHSVNVGAQSVFANVRPVIGHDFAEALRIIWPEPFASETIAHFLRVLETGQSYFAPSITLARRDSGVVESYEWEVHRVALPDGTLGVVCYFYESTRLRQIEAELREARRRSEAALLAGEVGTYYWDIINDSLSGDKNFAELFGSIVTENGTAPLATYIEALHPDDRASVSEQIRQTLQDNVPYRAEYRVRHAAGERWVIARGTVERDLEGKPVGWAGVTVEITDRKRAEEERRKLLESERAARAEAECASQMKDEFLATLSHELRTPLNAIVGWSQIIQSDPNKSADVTEGIEIIARNARVQAQIIEDLLDMSRIINGKVRLDVQRTDLAAVVRAAIETVRPTADAKGVRIQTVLDPLAGAIAGDPNRLQQIFWNLLTNAVKFTPRDGRVQVLLERVNSHVEVSVIDTGEGIGPDFLPYVFDRFRQADASASRRHGGLGLGLAIVRQLVELHGGSIRATSPGLGAGSTFIVALPLAIIHPDPEPVVQRRHPTLGSTTIAPDICVELAGVRVLVVDDEPDARALVKRLLEACDVSVTTAASTREAIKVLQEHRFDVLISDVGMPGEDGYALIKQVRSLGEKCGGNLPAIALTAYARSEDRIKVAVAGFQHHLPKPVEPAELLAIVAVSSGRAAHS